jgi:UDP-glucuronate decarboxylase
MKLNANVLDVPCEIIALDNLITAGVMGSEAPKERSIAFVNHDIIKPFYPERPVDYVLHLAGIASPYYYRKWPLETLEVATIGLKNVIELTKASGARLLFFSSSEIYGDPDAAHVPTAESYHGNVSCLGARACYDESKRLGETLIRIYQTHHGVKGMIVRPFNVYGPGMQKLDYRVLPNFAAKILASEPVNIYGTGQQTRTFCYVTDAIRGFLQVLLSGQAGEPYNIGNPTPEVTMLDLVHTIQKAVPELKVQHRLIEHPDTYPADEPQRRCPDITKAQLQVGYQPQVGMEDGLRRFFGWAKEAYAS